ncbi:hypothetical protein EJ05DRAFT_463504 [Pseudovirgaria hyperparasitica]|uniref:Prion-inhibition and propagation HeLo domain-containing protein n=1 Tax=Pseudovirgaria hyperparasitica TaxID=470096 RepID=A0A6A6W879_9PEZI|nr:uncharacterized protein EJ05DRAFT_463504 [Pseudovirgaria hyperparasitica]KAF2758853.1 hypothetical protein EJ05DRAFT_463504 [Pseudovirgaria hyperparasitica]
MSYVHFAYPQRLSKLYSDTKYSSQAVIQTNKIDNHPELGALHRKYRIQKDRLVAWGLDWRDKDAVSQDDIDEPVARAGLTETVTSVLGTIKDILDEADRMTTKSGTDASNPKDSNTNSNFDHSRYEDLAKDLTTSIDILYDLSRSITPRKESAAALAPLSKSRAALFSGAYSSSEITLVNPNLPNLSFNTGLPPKLDISSLVLAQEDPPPYDSTEAPPPCLVLGSLAQSHSSTNPWKTSGSKTVHIPVLVEYANFDPTYSTTGVAPPLDRLEHLLALLTKLQTDESTSAAFVCLGFFEDPKHARFGLVYEIPSFAKLNTLEPRSIQPTPLSTLLKASSASQKGNPTLPPPLEERFRLAFRVAKAVSKSHEIEFEHKDIRSSHILLFRNRLPAGRTPGMGATDFNVRQPLLCSFDLFSEYNTEVKAQTPHQDIYRHPQDPRNNGKNTSIAGLHFDMYSLALVLLEIGLWLPLSDLFKAKYSLDDFKIRLEDLWIRKLSAKCGSAYMQAVRECFTVADRIISKKQTAQSIPQIYGFVLTRLQRCCLLDEHEPSEEIHDAALQASAKEPNRIRKRQLSDQNAGSPKDSFPSHIVKRLSLEKESHISDARKQSKGSSFFPAQAPVGTEPSGLQPRQSVTLHDLSTAPTLRDDDPTTWDAQRNNIQSPSRESLSEISSLYKESFSTAASIIQRAWRTKTQRSSFKEYKRKVTIIQRRWKQKLAMQSESASMTTSLQDSSDTESRSALPYPTPEPELVPMDTTTMSIQIYEKPVRPKIRIHPIKFPQSVTDQWHESLLPRLERIISRALKDSPETISIDLMAIGATPAEAKPTIFVTCTSTSKVKTVLARKLIYNHEIFDLKVRKGRIRRSKLAQKSNRSVSRSNGNDVSKPENPYYYERPLCGASIGAFVGNEHLPPVSFGGVVIVDNEPYGMTVHHLLDPQSDDDESDSDDEISPEDITRSSARSTSDPCLIQMGLQPQLNVPDALDPFDISDEDYSEDDLGYDSVGSDMSDDETDVESDQLSSASTQGDVEGYDVGDGDELYITQPAFQDVDEDFFPNDEDAPEDHLDSFTLGHVHASSGVRRWTQNGIVHEIDWALLKLKDDRLQPFNLVQGGGRYYTKRDTKGGPQLRDPVCRRNFTPEEDEYPSEVAGSKDIGGLNVHCFGRTSGLKGGVTGYVMSSVRVYQRRSFSKSWSVVGGEFGEGGDSGAWVIDNESGRVCGHVLAYCERNRIAYICPMEVLLADMKRTLGATSIRLPGMVESILSTSPTEKEIGIKIPQQSERTSYGLPDLHNLSLGETNSLRSRVLVDSTPSQIDVSLGRRRQFA